MPSMPIPSAARQVAGREGVPDRTTSGGVARKWSIVRLATLHRRTVEDRWRGGVGWSMTTQGITLRGEGMQLSHEQRWILLNQYRLLKHLDPDAREECDRAIEVLSSGYELEYAELNQHILDPMPSEDCREVIDILEMHRQLRFSYDRLTDKSEVERPNDIEFRGFDGNEETRQFSYAHYLIHDEGKWKELAQSGDGLNSHSPVLGAYRRMLEVWKAIQESPQHLHVLDEGLLSSTEINQIVAARVHPDNK
jgi:uncharacterized protein